jgi:cell division protein FtsB
MQTDLNQMGGNEVKKSFFIVLIIIIVHFCLYGCGTRTTTDDAVLTQQLTLLEDRNKQLEEEIKVLEAENKSLNESIIQNLNLERDYWLLEMEHDHCFYFPEIINKNLTNVFHPGLLKKGDQVVGLIVKEIQEGKGREVLFKGQFTSKLKITEDKDYDYEKRTYKFEVVDSFDEKVPKDIFTYSKNNHMVYRLEDENATDLIKEIGTSLREGVEVTVVLDNYSIAYDTSNFVNRAHFVKLLSVDC